MKRRILLFTTLAFAFAAIVMSHDAGPGRAAGLNLTGSDGGTAGCDGSGCHNGGTFVNDNLTMTVTDNNFNPVNWFFPGNTYVITLRGTSTAPKWGYQISVSHTFDGVTYPAGWLTSEPPHAHDTFINNYPVVEHTHTLDVDNDTILAVAYWLAPIMPGVDSVNFKFAICNVDGDGSVDGDNSISFTDTLGHWTPDTDTTTPPDTTEPATVHSVRTNTNIIVSTYPNPVTDRLNISMENADNGIYTFSAYDMQGRMVANQAAMVSSAFQTTLNTGSWTPGLYRVLVSKGNFRKVVAILKQ